MRVIAVAIVAIVGACHGGAGRGATAVASRSTTGSGAGAQPTFCMEIEDGRAPSMLVADDREATVCTDLGLEAYMQRVENNQPPLPPVCGSVDLATGSWRAVGAPARKPPTSHRPDVPPAVEVKQDATRVQLCKAAGCTTLAVPPPREVHQRGEYGVAVSESLEHALVLEQAVKSIKIRFVNAATGQQHRTLVVDEDRQCLLGVEFLGDIVYVAYGPPDEKRSACDGPSDTGVLYRATGETIGTLADVRPHESSPIDLGGNRYAMVDRYGFAVAIVDANAAKSVTVRVPGVAGERSPFDAREDWFPAPLAVTPRGQLVVISPTLLVLVDPGSGKIEKQIRYPLCSR